MAPLHNQIRTLHLIEATICGLKREWRDHLDAIQKVSVSVPEDDAIDEDTPAWDAVGILCQKYAPVRWRLLWLESRGRVYDRKLVKLIQAIGEEQPESKRRSAINDALQNLEGDIEDAAEDAAEAEEKYSEHLDRLKRYQRTLLGLVENLLQRRRSKVSARQTSAKECLRLREAGTVSPEQLLEQLEGLQSTHAAETSNHRRVERFVDGRISALRDAILKCNVSIAW